MNYVKLTRNSGVLVLCLCLAFNPFVIPAVLAEGMGETTQIGSDLNDPNMGGATIGKGIGTPSGDSEVDNKQNAGCTNSRLLEKMISNTCWTCIFPIISLGMPWGAGSSGAPDDRYKSIACLCKDRNGVPFFGWTFGMWQPVKVIELVRKPGCLAFMNGIEADFSTKLGWGSYDMDSADANEGNSGVRRHSYANYHMYAYPLLLIMNMWDQTSCLKDKYNDLDILYMSEVDPTWNVDAIGFFMMPEVLLFSNPVAITACSADAISTSLFKKPLSSLFWCAGSWGLMYPMSGNVNYTSGEVMASSLFVARVLFVWHRRGLLRTTYGKSAMCKGEFTTHVPKKQYKITMLYPVPETTSAHVIGESTIKWGAGRAIPVTGEDFVYLIWTWNDCCMTATYGGA